MSRASITKAHQKIQELSWEPAYHTPVSHYGTDYTLRAFIAALGLGANTREHISETLATMRDAVSSPQAPDRRADEFI